MLLANAKMLWRKVASKSLDRTRNDTYINWLNGLNFLVWQDITYILIHFLPNSHICVLLQFIFTYMLLSCKYKTTKSLKTPLGHIHTVRYIQSVTHPVFFHFTPEKN